MIETQKKDIVIGLDIGTSSLKLVAFNTTKNYAELELTQSTDQARLKNKENPTFNEQSVTVILELVQLLFSQVTNDYYERLKAIQVCGQMHGLVLWNTITKQHSNLITWQDDRCTPEFLSNLPVQSVSTVNSGFGCATLFWLSKFSNSNLFSEFNACGTIQDYITYILAKSECGISYQNALSWGYFDLSSNNWQQDLKGVNNFPFEILPSTRKPGFKLAERVHLSDTKIIDSSSIHVALGDLQCSFYSCVENENDCVINISTSSQLCMAVTNSKYETLKDKLPSSITVNPYVDNKVLLVSASLNGGNVLDKFIETLIDWNTQLDSNYQADTPISHLKNSIWSKLINLAKPYLNSNSMLLCKPMLFGERHDPTTFASFQNLFAGNLNLGEVFLSICAGLVENLHSMFPSDILINELGCKRIIVTGNGVLRNPILKACLLSEFNELNVDFKENNDSATGAAKFLTDLLK